MKPAQRLCIEVEAVTNFTYPGDMIGVRGGCEVAVTNRTAFSWMKIRECDELVYGK